jgi:hypothetical protein
MSGTLPFGWSRSSSIAVLSFAIMSRTPLSKVVLQNFGFPGHRRQASIPEVHRDGRKLLLAVGVIFIGVEDGADRRDETGLNRLNVFCQMPAIAARFDAEQKHLRAKFASNMSWR